MKSAGGTGRMAGKWAGALLLAGLAGVPVPGWAQATYGSTPVVQPLPGEGPASLSAALLRLGRNPRDVEALIDAGNAALAMGDTDAAIGFFTRADKIMPNNAAIEAGLAGAKVHGEDPFAAIPLFQSAERNGPIPAKLLGDRGLAYDLVGDNANAQRFYRDAIARGAGADVVQQMAISQAIAGDRRGAELTLAPLLDKQDRAGWRTRAFVLAILGREEEAVSVVRATMPADLATGIAPYLRYMRQLTPAQQAAAANLGHFPRASEIGHDDPRIAQYAPAVPVRVATADAALVPAGQPLGKDKSRKDRKRGRDGEDAPVAVAVAAPPEPMPSRVSRSAEPQQLAGGELPPVHTAAPTSPARTAAGLRPVPPTLAAAKPLVTAPAAAPPVLVATAPPPTAPQPLAQRPAASTRVVVNGPGFSPLAGQGAAAANSFDLARTPAATAVAMKPASIPATAAAPAATQPAPTPAPVMTSPPAATALARSEVSPPPAPVVAAPVPRPAPPVRTAARPSFSDAFADLSARADVTPRAGAVDIRKIKAARPAPPPPPPPPPNPSRIWVQVGVGRSTDRLEFDWKRMVKDDPEVFRGRKAWVADWGRTNRLLVGPFETEKAADSFNEKLHKADRDGTFVWTSPAGQVVDAL